MCILRRLEIRKGGKSCRLEIFAPVPYKSSHSKKRRRPSELIPANRELIVPVLSCLLHEYPNQTQKWQLGIHRLKRAREAIMF